MQVWCDDDHEAMPLGLSERHLLLLLCTFKQDSLIQARFSLHSRQVRDAMVCLIRRASEA